MKNKEKKKKQSLVEKAKLFVKDYRRQLPLQMMVIPGIIFMIIFCYMPIYGLTIAFKSYTVIDTIDSAKWVGWANFKIVATDKYFWQSVINTLGISFLKLLIGFTTPIILSIMIYELRDGPFKRIIQTISYLPHFLSWIVLGVPIGGLKEKLLASKTAGITNVFVPRDNRSDVEELDTEITEGMNIIYVNNAIEVFAQALMR